MKLNCDYHATISDSICGREEIEWANFWYSNANVITGEGKILIIGDSTGRKVRSTIEKMSGRYVDYLGTSSGLHNRLFYEQLKSFFSIISYKYEVVFLWVGYHSLINDEGNSWEEKDYIRFEEDIRALIGYLSSYGERIILCSALYPVIKKENKNIIERAIYWVKPISRLYKEKILWDEACVIKKKNDILNNLATNLGLTYCDINSYLLSFNNNYFTRMIHSDKIHYESKSNKIIAKFFLDALSDRNPSGI